MTDWRMFNITLRKAAKIQQRNEKKREKWKTKSKMPKLRFKISIISKFSKPGFNSTWTINFHIFKLDLEKAEEPETKLPTSIGSSKKTREFQKNIYFCFIDYAKAFDCVDHYKLWKILKEMGIPNLTWLLRNLYADQEETVRIGHWTDWFQIG